MESVLCIAFFWKYLSCLFVPESPVRDRTFRPRETEVEKIINDVNTSGRNKFYPCKKTIRKASHKYLKIKISNVTPLNFTSSNMKMTFTTDFPPYRGIDSYSPPSYKESPVRIGSF
ncbi:hypothetical protein BH09BAC3_BH09BAC3_24710 [soil metagenome]